MYRDPALIKKHIVKVRLDDALNRQVEALADFTGDQKAVLLRQLVEMGLEQFHGVESGGLRDGVEVPVRAPVKGAIGF